MADKAQARLLVKEYLNSVGKKPLSENDELLEKLASMSPDEFKSAAFPTSLLDGCYYMGCAQSEYIETTNPGISLELFSDFCHSFVFCFTGCTKEDIEQGHNTFKNYTLAQKREIAPQELCKNLPHGARVEKDFYIVWTIYRRNEGVATEFGPKYFSILAMNGDVLGNYGVVFHYGNHKPLCISLPTDGIAWSLSTFRYVCNHRPRTSEVVRHQFVPAAKQLMDMCFSQASSRPEFLLTLHPFISMGFDYDDFGSTEFYNHFWRFFPEKVLEIPGNLCRNGKTDNLILYRGK